MEGCINSNREFVWINLAEDQRHYVQDIGQFLPPTQGWFDRAMSGIGLAETPPHWANLGSWGLNKDHPKMSNMIQSLPMIVMSSKKEFFVTKDGTLLHLCSTNIDDAVVHIIAADMARNGKTPTRWIYYEQLALRAKIASSVCTRDTGGFELKLHNNGSSGGSITVAFIHESLKPSSTYVDYSYRVEGTCEITFTKHLSKCVDCGFVPCR
jgi:hypothetical protein